MFIYTIFYIHLKMFKDYLFIRKGLIRYFKVVPRGGIEPSTRGFSVLLYAL